jgi:hypothetical protein
MKTPDEVILIAWFMAIIAITIGLAVLFIDF